MSRYPSAYGHTPSYKSVGSYPSALSGSDLDTGLTSNTRMRNMELDMDREMGAMRREMDRDFHSVSVCCHSVLMFNTFKLTNDN